MRIYLIRHGDPDYANDSLTPQGHREAEALACYLENEGIDLLYCSPKGRARATAAWTSRRLGKPVSVEDWTAELALPSLKPSDYAAWNVHGHDVRTAAYLDNPSDYRALGMLPLAEIEQSVRTVRAESDRFLAAQGFVRDGGVYKVTRENRSRVALFCHGGFGLTWLSVLLEIPLPLVWSGFFLHTSSVTQILFDERMPGIATPRCLMLSALPHLYKAGLDVGTSGIVGNCD